MRTRDPADTAADLEDAIQRLPIGARVTDRRGNPGTVAWHPFVCDAGTVSIIVKWDRLPPDRNTTYTFTRELISIT
jgi:hypothetical protein